MADNPFNDNPFNSNNVNGTVPAAGAWDGTASAGAWGGSAAAPPPAWGDSTAAPPPAYVAPLPVVGAGSSGAGAGSLAKREAELNRREAELQRREEELRASGGGAPVKNWPPFCAFTHHDIRGDIPPGNQGMVRAAYWAYLGVVVCLFFNWIGTVAALIGVGGDYLASFLWAAIYGLGGIPLAFLLWYRAIYRAGISDSALSYGLFFAFFMGHLIFTGWSAIAPPILNSKSHTGIWSGIQMVSKNTGVGVMYFIGGGLWCLEFVWSFWVLKLVYANFRGEKRSGMPTFAQELAAQGAQQGASRV